MAGEISVAEVSLALNLAFFDVAGARTRMAPVPRGWSKRKSGPRRAAVMVLLYPEDGGRIHVALTLRQAGLRGHSGQVSFPGGRMDEEDADLAATAIRETCEEIGVCGEGVRILGGLERLYIPASHYDVHPVVGICEGRPAFVINPEEVAEAFGFALDDLLCPSFKREEWRVIGGRSVRVPYYAVGRHKVWGATAILLGELEERLRVALAEERRMALGR